MATPAGPVSVAADGEWVRRVELGCESGRGRRPGALAREAARQLRAYFDGRRQAFDLPLRLEATPFTLAVLRALAGVPWGRSCTYGQLARRIGRPAAARAVGRAVGINPLPILIPCHRVLAAGSRLGGFGAGLDWKRFLLALEGMAWTEGGTAPAR